MNSTTDHTIDQDNCLACQEERKAPKPVENGELRETILSILGIVDRTSGNRPEQIATLEQEITAHINAEIAKAKLEAFDVAFDCHDYDRLRAYRAELLKEVK